MQKIICRSILIILLILTNATFGEDLWITHDIELGVNGPGDIFMVDLDGDGDIDGLAAIKYESKIVWGENDGQQNFTNHIIEPFFGEANAVYAYDLDQDGDMDVLGTAYTGNEIAWWENDGDCNFTKHILGDNLDGASQIYVADIDSDGDPDILGTAVYSKLILWWENIGNSSFIKHIIANNEGGASGIGSVDMDQDGDMDIVSCSAFRNEVDWWENDGEQNFIKHTIEQNYDFPVCVLAVDLDQDGDWDVVGGAKHGGQVTWWENNGQQSFTNHTFEEDLLGAFDFKTADLDNDNDIDIVGVGIYCATAAWWENDGNENFTKHLIDDNFNAARSVFPIDIDQDGDIDIFGAAKKDDKIVWWESLLDDRVSDIYIAPDYRPIVIPPGGSIGYTGFVRNHFKYPHYTDILVGYQNPAGDFIPLQLFSDIFMNSYQTISEHHNQTIDSNISPGSYRFIAYSGNANNEVWRDSSDFWFYVFPPEDNTISNTPSNGRWNSEDSINNIIKDTSLLAAYPNPFNAKVNLSFALDNKSDITLDIFDLYGRKVIALYNGVLRSGSHTFSWDASGYSSGVYFARLIIDNNSCVKKINLLK